ncbi:hypothetical protein BLA24064_01983 [Burkholderia latens]|uniref:Uncharacterized protein n=1 Tax=Burkholderia latens TaxID=488446 RepID=A0A6P2JQC7_9BURK|nr:hypothetical protein BLA24064_01983 [Burkholderia latens]
MPVSRGSISWWGGQSAERISAFWLDTQQQEWLLSVREKWDGDVVIQIYGGSIRLRTERGDWRFSTQEAMSLAT